LYLLIYFIRIYYKFTFKKENCGWMGDILCLICVSVHGINKDSIMRILAQKGYVNDLKVNCIRFFIIYNFKLSTLTNIF
jgi:hypothetical protein